MKKQPNIPTERSPVNKGRFRPPALCESLLRLVGLTRTVPGFSTLSRRQKTLAAHIPYRGSKGSLYLLASLGQWMHCMKLLGHRLMARDFTARSRMSRSAAPS
jgi:hypothetical protein